MLTDAAHFGTQNHDAQTENAVRLRPKPSTALSRPGTDRWPGWVAVVSGVREVEFTGRAGWVVAGCRAGDMSVAAAGLWSAGIVMEPDSCW